jgi:phage shock protein E
MRLVTTALVVVAPIAQALAAGAPAKIVSGAEAKQLIDAGARVLDVRTPEEFADGHVEGALNIPFEQVAARVAELGDPSKPLVVYCRSGRRSGIATRTLQDLGFAQLSDMQTVSSWPGTLVKGDAKPAASPATVTATAQAALAPFKKSLKEALAQGLAKGGPESAVDVCAGAAPELLKAGEKPGVKVGRTADRLRNAKLNAAPAWVATAVEGYRASKGGEPKVIDIDAARVGYVEPIMVAPLCLSCHGKELKPGVAKAIKARYPGDQATGYEAGDFRGVAWVEMERSAVK